MEINSLPSTFPVGQSLNQNSKSDVQQSELNENLPVNSTNDTNVFPESKLKDGIEDMNKAMEALNADIRFKLHQETGILIVQVVDEKNDKVLKEFPPHEFLDTKAKIREYIGVLLDIKG